MKTKQGEEIIEFTQLRSSTYSMARVAVCVGITNKYVILKHKGSKNTPWVLDQAGLDNSVWVHDGMCKPGEV